MKIEHAAYTMQDPVAAAKWYSRHLGFKVIRSMTEEPFTHFLADSSGCVLIEIYNNPKAPVPDYKRQDPLIMHLAFVCDTPEAGRDRLLAAGATLDTDLFVTPAGDKVVMLRDPWGFPIQLCKRAEHMIREDT